MPYHETLKIPYQKTLSRNLKSALSCLKKVPYQKKKLIKNREKMPYQGTLKRM